MLDVGNQSTFREPSDWTLNNFSEKSASRSNAKILRKFINSAIYVEKPVSATVSSGNVSQKFSSEDLLEIKTKRCVCSLGEKTCPCHINNFISALSSEEKLITNPVGFKKPEIKTKISQASVKSSNDKPKVEIKKITPKNDEEKRKKKLKEMKQRESKLKDKEVLLQQERENFKKWLMNKKKIELENKKKKEREEQEQQLKSLEKEKRQLENQLNFQLWLKKKKEEQLEMKIKKEIELINELERKERQLRENEKAFNEWLKNSKNKPKPLPLNRGLQSLRSASSVTYVNPNPWNSVP